ncbi:hypothetical protein WICPIJ_008429 [Wickerhamomyces pijperi]|uniref:Uncharacterized protein n=1 Tax=Wickerhamomyces pijperi TaxID=599730 RepID=A0A9P8PXC0_WICPI|nr:hypothetical protein WICPIJ_008429 [Wickerhamomyces pijperi]
MIFSTMSADGLFFKWANNKQAKSVWRPSSRQINSLEKVKPGIKPLFFNQKMEAKEPEKKIPSTAAKATNLSPNKASSSEIHLRAQSAFCLIHGMFSMALNKKSDSFGSLMYVSIKRE